MGGSESGGPWPWRWRGRGRGQGLVMVAAGLGAGEGKGGCLDRGRYRAVMWPQRLKRFTNFC